jgi:hypothetical protein
MKKVLFLLLALTLFNCSNDDDSQPGDGGDPIVGEWTLYRSIKMSNGQWETIDSDEESSTETFNADGTYSWTEEGDSGSGTWERMPNGQYRIYFTDGVFWQLSYNFYCGNNISSYGFLLQEYSYFKKVGYNEDNCDEVTYPN